MYSTYEDLKAFLDKMSADQLKQKIQVMTAGSISDETTPAILQGCYAIGTIAETIESDSDGNKLESHQFVRDSEDGLHHSESIVMYVDYSGYEDDSVYNERRSLFSVIQKIAEGEDGKAKDLARGVLDRIEHRAEKKKKKYEGLCLTLV